MLRPATLPDIPQLQRIRNAVQENRLSDPGLVKDSDYVDYLTTRGRGWVHTEGDAITGFAIVDMHDHNIWALFVDPAFEGKSIGRQLHDAMLNWYFQQTRETVWLSTAFNTRAERFYRKAGWIETGLHGTKEIRFEMRFEDWKGGFV